MEGTILEFMVKHQGQKPRYTEADFEVGDKLFYVDIVHGCIIGTTVVARPDWLRGKGVVVAPGCMLHEVVKEPFRTIEEVHADYPETKSFNIIQLL